MIERKDFLNDTWDDFRAACVGRTLYVWGAGGKGEEILHHVRTFDSRWEIAGFIDGNPAKTEFHGYPVHAPAWLASQDSERYVVLISPDRPGAIAASLAEMGAKYYFSYFWLDAPMKNVRDYKGLDEAALADVERILVDDESKRLLHEVADRYRAGFLDYSDLAAQGSEYFREEFFQDSGREVFVDGGAFDGDSIEEFFDWTRGVYDAIYSFEADPRMAEVVRKKLYRYHDVHLYAKGLYDSNVELPIELDNKVYSSRINVHSGGVLPTIPCMPLDDAIAGNPCTFIKMDIEGAEIPALAGAKATILANQPKLAICIYHKPKDLWEIPLLLHDWVPEYQMHIRHFGPRYYSTVLYAHL